MTYIFMIQDRVFAQDGSHCVHCHFFFFLTILRGKRSGIACLQNSSRTPLKNVAIEKNKK